MNWLHAFRFGGGDMPFTEVNEIIAFIRTHGYEVVRELRWINEVRRIDGDECVYVRHNASGEFNHQAHIIHELPEDLVIALNDRFGNAYIDIWFAEEEPETKAVFIKPNVGAATILPLPR